MVHPFLFLHWKQIRFALIPFAIAAFGLPLLSVQGLGTPAGMEGTTLEAYRIVDQLNLWLPLYPALAGLVGVTLALSAWNWDHQLGHVYALTLPVQRWEYVLLKMSGGLILSLVPIGAFWVGSQVAAASVSLPEGLHAYPNQLALRFFLATTVAYAALFAMAAGTVRTTVWISAGTLAFLVLGAALNVSLARHVEFFQRHNLVEMTMDWLVRAPGPLQVFTGSWTLIDV